MDFTLVSTVFNEENRLEQTISDLRNQTIQPSEIIITDAGSTDRTCEILKKWQKESIIPIIILIKKNCNVAEGRNLAIQKSRYNLIASTDFGCRFNNKWLETLINPFKDPNVYVVGGGFTVNESEQISLAAKASYIISNGFNINFKSSNFIPSSRSIAYRKEVYYKIGGYCEWLTLAADDLVFGKELIANGYKINIVEEPLVFWGRHEEAQGFIKEAFRYGLGEGEAKIQKGKFKEYFLQALSRYIFIIFCATSFIRLLVTNEISWGLVLVSMPLIWGYRPYGRYLRTWLKFKSKKYNIWVLLYGFYLIERLRISYIKGYLKGYFFSKYNTVNEALLLNKRLLNSDNF